MTSENHGQSSPMRVSIPNGLTSHIAAPSQDLPPIHALFHIKFDLKAGYSLAWKRALPGVELDGVVEYKSLPSGLHTVKEDLIYFVHGSYAGLSAFMNVPDGEEQRNARMFAVGVLVPLSLGRLGRSWKHAEGLKALGRQLAQGPDNTSILEEYWESNKAKDQAQVQGSEASTDSPTSVRFKTQSRQLGKGHGRKRSASEGTVLVGSGHTLSPHHPAWSLSKMLSIFGPLIFPIYRAALLRRRILISCHAPVQEICDFVYNISVLSNIPLAVTSLIQPDSPPHRLRPLFAIGVHDIPFLEEDAKASTTGPSISIVGDGDSEENGQGWIACTTDGILGIKSNLYDILITLPTPDSSSSSSTPSWPTVIDSNGRPLQATQRDLRRYKALTWGLSRAFSTSPPPSLSITRQKTSSSTTSLVAHPSVPQYTSNSNLFISDTDSIVEPLSWSALAYTGFMWWASAGERQISMDDEFASDSSLLDDLSVSDRSPTEPTSRAGPRDVTNQGASTSNNESSRKMSEDENSEHQARKEMAIIAYFHRLTTLILTTLSDIVDATDSDDERSAGPYQDAAVAGSDGGDEAEDDDDLTGPAVYVDSGDMAKMGLDNWSVADHKFVQGVCRNYFGRKAVVEGNAVDICGIRIC